MWYFNDGKCRRYSYLANCDQQIVVYADQENREAKGYNGSPSLTSYFYISPLPCPRPENCLKS